MEKFALKPASPGEILRDKYLTPRGLTQRQLADRMGMEVKAINRIVNSRTSISPILAIKLGKAFGTTAEFWLAAQNSIDLFRVGSRLSDPGGVLEEELFSKTCLRPVANLDTVGQDGGL